MVGSGANTKTFISSLLSVFETYGFDVLASTLIGRDEDACNAARAARGQDVVGNKRRTAWQFCLLLKARGVLAKTTHGNGPLRPATHHRGGRPRQGSEDHRGVPRRSREARRDPRGRLVPACRRFLCPTSWFLFNVDLKFTHTGPFVEDAHGGTPGMSVEWL
ncbi:hypothetical protein B0H14DRAFT_165068 [Mycena olivaceomarginata]|nr:hypothetical protein B0H14DRAFT_165068 [Mycena olivaceomarginata]